MIKKKLIALLLALLLLASTAFTVVNALADDVNWRYDSVTKTLYISGAGDMENYSSPYSTPWSTYLNLIECVVVEDGVESLGNNAFSGASSLSEVKLSPSVAKIGSGTFSSCQSLNELSLSPAVVSIGDVSFAKLGTEAKPNFKLIAEAGSYPLYYAIENEINFECESVPTGKYSVKIPARTGMTAYYPYEAKLNGTFVFYSESKFDPSGYVYDSEFNLIEENDDYDTSYSSNMDSCDFSLSVNLEKGKTYYFATDIINPNLKADYSVYIKGLDYYVSGGIYVMANPKGDLTDIKLYDAYLNDEPTNGEYSLHITEVDYTVKIECDGIVWYHTFNPDGGNDCDIPFMGCDLNADRVVNAKDYALMKKTKYKYTELFYEFMNFKY